MIGSKTIALAFASLLLGGAAMAQAPATAPKATTAAPAAKTDAAPMASDKKDAKPHTAASIECSKQADAKGLHGKERHKFRSECKKNAGKT